jgi:hypothetical protein
MIITLSGSTRFESEFIKAQRELSRAGINFFSLAVLPQHREPGEDWSDGSYDKVIADLLYFDRILHSDAVIVLGDGYIGMSTAREILWAKIQNKPICSHYPELEWLDTISRLRQGVYETEDLVVKAEEFFKRQSR